MITRLRPFGVCKPVRFQHWAIPHYMADPIALVAGLLRRRVRKSCRSQERAVPLHMATLTAVETCLPRTRVAGAGGIQERAIPFEVTGLVAMIARLVGWAILRQVAGALAVVARDGGHFSGQRPDIASSHTLRKRVGF